MLHVKCSRATEFICLYGACHCGFQTAIDYEYRFTEYDYHEIRCDARTGNAVFDGSRHYSTIAKVIFSMLPVNAKGVL